MQMWFAKVFLKALTFSAHRINYAFRMLQSKFYVDGSLCVFLPLASRPIIATSRGNPKTHLM